MVSFCLAWVMVTAIKSASHNNKTAEMEFSPMAFFVTGMVDLAIVATIFYGISTL